jgi:hypothetical protein
MKQLLGPKVTMTTMIVFSAVLVSVATLIGILLFLNSNFVKTHEAEEKLQKVVNYQEESFASSGMYADSMIQSIWSEDYMTNNSIWMKTNPVRDCYGLFLPIESGDILFVSSEDRNVSVLSKDNDWMKEKPDNYPDGCDWPFERYMIDGTPTRPNYAENSSFEDPKLSELRDWSEVPTDAGDGEAPTAERYKTASAHSGLYAFKATSHQDGTKLSYLLPMVPSNKGNIVLSMRVRANVGVVIKPLLANEKNDSGYDYEPVVTSAHSVVGTGEWETIYMEALTPSSYVDVTLFGYSAENVPDGATVELDSMQITDASDDLETDIKYMGL